MIDSACAADALGIVLKGRDFVTIVYMTIYVERDEGE